MRVSTRRPDVEAFTEFASRVRQADGVEAFGEASVRDVREDRPARYLAIYDPELIALVVMGGEGSELAVHPERRNQGWGSELVSHLTQTVSPIRAWAHGDSEGARRLGRRFGLERVRTLLRMRAHLDPTAGPGPVDGERIRPATPDDYPDIVAVNAAAFATHGEQGDLRIQDIRAKGGDIFVLDENGIRGFVWLQRDPAELYVIGVDPRFQGRGYGTELVKVAIDELARGGAAETVLFVDGDQDATIGLYEKAGFRVDRTDVQYELPQS